MRRCLLAPPSAVFDAVRLLDSAADAHLAGDLIEADRLISAANIPAVRAWTEKLWGAIDPAIHRIPVDRPPGPLLSKEERVPARMPNAAERAQLLERDGLHCRFCGVPLIETAVRKAVRTLYPESLPWGRRNVEQHAAFQALWLQFDHLTPHSRGGDNSMNNLAVTCAPCNFGRSDYTLEELDLENPLDRDPVRSDWDGLRRFLP